MGGTATGGRLEVRIDGRWGTVCGDGFGAEDALAACRTLGFVATELSTPGKPQHKCACHATVFPPCGNFDALTCPPLTAPPAMLFVASHACCGVGLAVTSGASYCSVDARGCATDGTGEHGNNEACTIRVGAAGTLTATQFDTESCCDQVTIGATRYNGSTGPYGVVVAAGSTFTWISDYSVTNAGWTICLTPNGNEFLFSIQPASVRSGAAACPYGFLATFDP